MRLIDFDAYVRVAALGQPERRAMNHAFFPICEAVRLRLQDCKTQAPFRKIVVTVDDAAVAGRWHGSVSCALNVCEVTEAVDVKTLVERIGQVGWMVSVVEQGLKDIVAATGWRDEEVKGWLRVIREAKPPCQHRLRRLHVERDGIRCDTWFCADVGVSAIEARFVLPDGRASEVVVFEKPEPIFMEDEFPAWKAKVQCGEYILLARDKTELARVRIPH